MIATDKYLRFRDDPDHLTPAPRFHSEIPGDRGLWAIPIALAIGLTAAAVLWSDSMVMPQAAATPGPQVSVSSKSSTVTSHAGVHGLWISVAGRRYSLNIRDGQQIEGELPPGFGFGKTVADVPIARRPQLAASALITVGTPVIISGALGPGSCWHLLLTLQGGVGYFCTVGTSDVLNSTSITTHTDDFRSSDPDGPQFFGSHNIPVAPHGYGCASVRGIFENLSLNGDTPRRFELPLCGK